MSTSFFVRQLRDALMTRAEMEGKSAPVPAVVSQESKGKAETMSSAPNSAGAQQIMRSLEARLAGFQAQMVGADAKTTKLIEAEMLPFKWQHRIALINPCAIVFVSGIVKALRTQDVLMRTVCQVPVKDDEQYAFLMDIIKSDGDIKKAPGSPVPLVRGWDLATADPKVTDCTLCEGKDVKTGPLYLSLAPFELRVHYCPKENAANNVTKFAHVMESLCAPCACLLAGSVMQLRSTRSCSLPRYNITTPTVNGRLLLDFINGRQPTAPLVTGFYTGDESRDASYYTGGRAVTLDLSNGF